MYREIKEDESRLDRVLGYIYFTDKDHPLAKGNANKVYYHRHLKSIELKRWLTSSEICHHKDGNKLNNKISNLEILSSSEHARLHNTKLLNKECLTCKKLYKPRNSTQKYCSVKCYNNISEIKLEDIIYWVTNYSWKRAGRELGLSDNGVRKRFTKLTGLSPKHIFSL